MRQHVAGSLFPLMGLSLLQFGYTRKDVILLGGGILGFGYALYYGLQAAGYDALVAGNIVQIFVFLGIGVGYISTYIFRVANKVRSWALSHRASCEEAYVAWSMTDIEYLSTVAPGCSIPAAHENKMK